MGHHSDLPLVSVYISTCNRVEKLKRAIDSVLKQDFADFELLVCDDASIDGTMDYMHSLVKLDSRVHYLRNEVNKGACATRNLGIFSARGKYITGLDDDDEFTKDRLSVFLNHWQDKYFFICANFMDAYSNDERIPFYKNKRDIVEFSYKDILFKNIASNQIFTLTQRLQEINGFDVSVKRFQDWDTWLRLSYHFRGIGIRLSQCTYIMHHDHSIDEPRVSKNSSVEESLIALLDRNGNIYTNIEASYMRSFASHMSKELGFFERVRWAGIKLTYYFFFKAVNVIS